MNSIHSRINMAQGGSTAIALSVVLPATVANVVRPADANIPISFSVGLPNNMVGII